MINQSHVYIYIKRLQHVPQLAITPRGTYSSNTVVSYLIIHRGDISARHAQRVFVSPKNAIMSPKCYKSEALHLCKQCFLMQY